MFYFHPYLGFFSQFDGGAYFSDGWENNHQPEFYAMKPAPTWKAELGEADSTFIFAARLRSMPQGGHPWPPARQKEAVKNTMQDAVLFFFFCVCVCGMLAEDETCAGSNSLKFFDQGTLEKAMGHKPLGR